MKIKTRICDICGNPMFRHGRDVYKIKKRHWETELLGKQMDICDDCFEKFIKFVRGQYTRPIPEYLNKVKEEMAGKAGITYE